MCVEFHSRSAGCQKTFTDGPRSESWSFRNGRDIWRTGNVRHVWEACGLSCRWSTAAAVRRLDRCWADNSLNETLRIWHLSRALVTSHASAYTAAPWGETNQRVDSPWIFTNKIFGVRDGEDVIDDSVAACDWIITILSHYALNGHARLFTTDGRHLGFEMGAILDSMPSPRRRSRNNVDSRKILLNYSQRFSDSRFHTKFHRIDYVEHRFEKKLGN